MTQSGHPFTIRFGVYELDLQSGELHKGHSRIRLQEQPLRVLIALLNRPGEVVTREALRQELWPSDTFVDFEHGLRAAVNKLRQALNDDADKPRYVETLPRRGYRFLSPVTLVQSPATKENANPVKIETGKTRRFAWQAAFSVLLAALAMVICASWFFSVRPRPLTDRDTIVLADFANETGDPVFDGTLHQGLSVQLAQSPFLSILPDMQVRKTLLMMKQPEDARLTSAIVTEVCRRNNSTALVDGSIAQIGTQYFLILKAEDCSNGRLIASTEARATDKNHVLDALGKASASLRERLGESITTVEKFDTPIEQATTSSLPALQAFDTGGKLADKGDFAGALPFFQRARDLDPNFVMASLLQGMMQWNLGYFTDARKNLQKAFDQRSSVSEWERFFIETEYNQTRNSPAGDEAWGIAATLWTRTYPRDCTAHTELAFYVVHHEQFEKALLEEKEAHRLCPGDGLTSAGLIDAYTNLNRFAEARAVSEEPQVKDVDSFEVQLALYRLAFLQNDTAAMEREVAFAAGKPGLEDQMWQNQASTAAYYGRMKDSYEFSRKGIASALAAGEQERAVMHAEVVALREAYVGNLTVARQRLSEALRLPNSANVGTWNVLEVLAILGEETRFKPLAEKYAKENANDSDTQNNELPRWAAFLALARHDPPAAMQIIHPRPDDARHHCPDNTYVRGLAYLANHQGKEAAAEFQKMIDYRILLSNGSTASLAHLQLGRALVLQGDTARARAAYQDFLTLWKDADPDVPIFQQAKAELGQLH